MNTIYLVPLSFKKRLLWETKTVHVKILCVLNGEIATKEITSILKKPSWFFHFYSKRYFVIRVSSSRNEDAWKINMARFTALGFVRDLRDNEFSLFPLNSIILQIRTLRCEEMRTCLGWPQAAGGKELEPEYRDAFNYISDYPAGLRGRVSLLMKARDGEQMLVPSQALVWPHLRESTRRWRLHGKRSDVRQDFLPQANQVNWSRPRLVILPKAVAHFWDSPLCCRPRVRLC